MEIMDLLASLGFRMDFRTQEERLYELAEEIIFLRSELSSLKEDNKSFKEELQELHKVIGDVDLELAIQFWKAGFTAAVSEGSKMTSEQVEVIRELFRETKNKLSKTEQEALVGKMTAHKNGQPQSVNWADAAIRKLQRILHQ